MRGAFDILLTSAFRSLALAEFHASQADAADEAFARYQIAGTIPSALEEIAFDGRVRRSLYCDGPGGCRMSLAASWKLSSWASMAVAGWPAASPTAAKGCMYSEYIRTGKKLKAALLIC